VTERGAAEGLRRALRAAALIVLPVGVFWSAIGVANSIPSLASQGLVGALLALWLLFETRGERPKPEATLAIRIAYGAQVAAVIAVVGEPIIGIAIAVSSLIPITLALPYVSRRSLTTLMAVSAAVGAFALMAPVTLPWGTRASTELASLIPTLAVILVYILFLVFLWNASTRLTDTADELRHVIEMSHDLAATLDPTDVGFRLAKHMALAAHADDCVLSTWDRDTDRVVTFGSYPIERGYELQPWYDLAAFPATRKVLEERVPSIIRLGDPDADPAEAGYMREVGKQQTLVMLPFIVRGESIGIVELGSKRAGAFTARDIEVAQLLAREAALTFDNARLYDELRLFAYRDPLTGLANRARLQDRVEHALERLRGRSPNHVAVLFIDLDHFKHVNDRFGHAMGDAALKIIAERIKTIIRPGDTAGRLGGDEFAVLLEDVESPEVVAAVSDRLLEGLSMPVDLGETAPIVGASIGFALSTPEISSDDLLRNADIAMYAAKAGGRGQIVAFRPDLMETASARTELAALLRGAASRHELQLAFQPVVRIEDGDPIGVEALVRWQPPGHLLHLPAEFLELAEETGEILPIGRWVIGEGCRRLRTWQQRYDLPDLQLYVNLSARQFRDPGLVPMIVEALGETSLDPKRLTLEITEGTLLTPGFETVERIGELRALGLRLAIDDFGTGYSSLGYLHAFQIDELKIDRSFVPGEEGVGDAHVLSQAIVELGRALSLEMIAEGIETQAQADWFATLGCRYGQGFLYARPMGAADLDRYLRGHVGLASTRQKRGGDGLSPVGPGTPKFPGGITDVFGARKASPS
jgi:diguanylate cyclase (GGDEF)-like protein